MKNNLNKKENTVLSKDEISFLKKFNKDELQKLDFILESVKNKESKQEFIKNFFKEKDINYWLNLKTIERKKIKINGYGLTKISSLFGVEGTPDGNKDVWIKLLEKIFDTKINEKKQISKQDIIDFFRSQDLEHWEKYDIKDRMNLRIKGNNLDDVANLFGIKVDFILNEENWFKLLKGIFNTKIENKELNKEEIKNFLKKEDLNFWIEKNEYEISFIRINGNNIHEISNFLGIKGSPIKNRNSWLNLLEIIYETKIEKKELTKEYVIEYFRSKSLDYWINLSQKEKLSLKINGKGLNAISSLLGIKGNPLYTKVWVEFLEEVFDTKIEIKK